LLGVVVAAAVLGVTAAARGVLAAVLADDPPTETNGGSIVEDLS
jgi:hypothetical protein